MVHMTHSLSLIIIACGILDYGDCGIWPFGNRADNKEIKIKVTATRRSTGKCYNDFDIYGGGIDYTFKSIPCQEFNTMLVMRQPDSWFIFGHPELNELALFWIAKSHIIVFKKKGEVCIEMNYALNTEVEKPKETCDTYKRNVVSTIKVGYITTNRH